MENDVSERRKRAAELADRLATNAKYVHDAGTSRTMNDAAAFLMALVAQEPVAHVQIGGRSVPLYAQPPAAQEPVPYGRFVTYIGGATKFIPRWAEHEDNRREVRSIYLYAQPQTPAAGKDMGGVSSATGAATAQAEPTTGDAHHQSNMGESDRTRLIEPVARPQAQDAVQPLAQLLYAHEAVLTEMRTHAKAGGIIAEWVKRLDFERDEYKAATGLDPWTDLPRIPTAAQPAGDDLAMHLAAMCGWFETCAEVLGWTRKNGASAWSANDAARAALAQRGQGGERG